MKKENLCVCRDAKLHYADLAPAMDPDRFVLFWAAQDILGELDPSHFAYEDNCGYFEEADGRMLLAYLLVQHSDKLGDVNSNRQRWEIVRAGYEKCVDLTIDETTPEYLDFERKLYVGVLERLGGSVPAEQQAKEVAA